jgi:ABC-2 type transport system ATP-binding protein
MSAPAIEVRDLSVTFPARGGRVQALDSVNLAVPAGQVFGFLGPNGAGKTTAMHVLLGFTAPTSGEAFLFGRNVRESIARERIGYLAEHPDTYRFLTGRELLTFSGRLFRMERTALKKRVREVLDMVGLSESADRRIATYSRGMMQRICLGQSLVHDPDLLILDEPTGGLDPIGRMDVRDLILQLRTRGKTVFFSSHELSEVELVCDHLAVLSGGKVVAQGATADLVPAGERLETFFMRAVGAAARLSPASAGADGRPGDAT